MRKLARPTEKLLLICWISLMSLSCFAQTIKVKGIVRDENREAIPGVTVMEKGSSKGIATDKNGEFNVDVSSRTATLTLSMIGYAKQELTLTGKANYEVILKSSVRSLNNVVVIGYGTQRKEDVNGAVSSVKAADIADIPKVSLDQMLQGKAAGVTITQNSGAPGSQTSVRIRGITALSGSNEPLYVIDGVPISGDGVTNSPLHSNNVGQDETAVSPLASINPSDIESIDILKDASATAIYGSRAANGVIIVTTKRGKAGSARVGYDGYYGVQQQGKFLEMMDLKQYANLQNSLADLYLVNRRPEFANPQYLGEGTKWQKEIFRSAPMQSHQVSVSGGSNGLNYYTSAAYLKQKGTILGSDFGRYSFRTNIDGQVKPWFKVGVNVYGSQSDENVGIGSNVGIIYNALLTAPDQPIYNADGTFAGPQADQIGGSINAVAQALSLINTLTRSNVGGNIYNDIRIFKDLTLRSEIGGSFNWSNNTIFNPSYTWGLYTNPTANLNKFWQKSTFYNWKEYLNYSHTFQEKHRLTVLLGHELSQTSFNSISAFRQGFFSNDVPTLNLGDAASARNDEGKSSTLLESVFARAFYTYNNKYSLTATIRADRSSNFAPGYQTGYFPSFAASWRISEEAFMAPVKKIADNIKIRVGYGEVGNQDIPGYQYGSALTPTITGLGTGFFVDKIANPELTWQTSIQTNVGVDFTLLNNRIDASFDWYYKTSRNFLFRALLPGYIVGGSAGLGGLAPPFINSGKLDNKGYDMTIRTVNITSPVFKWNSTIIFSRYKNVVSQLPVGANFIVGNIVNGYLPFTATKTVVGGPVGEFFGYKVQGIFQSDAQLKTAPVQFGRPVNFTNSGTWLGDIQYQDVNGDGKIDDKDQVPLGDPNPQFTYGFTNNFSYKGFDLSIFLQGSYGSQILNQLNYAIGGLSDLYKNQLAASSDFWSPTNSTSNIPAPKAGKDNPNLFLSDRFLESGSYLRIQNVNLGYNLYPKWITRLKLTKLKVYVSAQNLYTITKYKGLDPEIGSMNQSPFLSNIDLGRYPSPRLISFGINAEF